LKRMKEVGSPKLLFENLDLTPIHSILWTGLHTEGPGRPVEYDPEWDLRALMLRQLLQIPYMKDLVKRLKRNPYLRKMCGYGEKAPTEAHFSQMKKRIGAEGFLIIEAYLRHEALKLREAQPLSAVGLVQAACVDGTGLEAWSSRSLEDSRRGLGDPDARLGRGKNGFYLGYRSLFLTDMEGFPLGHVEAPANENEKKHAPDLLDKTVEAINGRVRRLVADPQYSSRRFRGKAASCGVEAIIPYPRNQRRGEDVLRVYKRFRAHGPEGEVRI
jgi:hypothetical protein